MGRGERRRETREKSRRSDSSSSSTERSRRRRSPARSKRSRRSRSRSGSRGRGDRRRRHRDDSDSKRRRRSPAPEERPVKSDRGDRSDDTESKIEKAIRAAEAAGLTMCKLPSYERKEVVLKEDMPTIQDRNALDELNADSFVQRQFTSSRGKRAPTAASANPDSIVIDLDAQTVKVPDVELPPLDSLFHPDEKNQDADYELSHSELVEITTSSLFTLMQTDELMKDIPSDITLEELIAKTEVEYGRSITVTLLREREAPLDVIVPQGTASVGYLKKAIRRQFEIYQKRSKRKTSTKISWRYIWKKYALECDGNILLDDAELLSAYGVSNRSKMKFIEKHRLKRM